MSALLWVVLGSSVGAPARYLLDRFVQDRHERIFPWGTLVINVTGSFALGVLVGVADSRGVGSSAHWVIPGVGTGFLGGFTTFSTFTWETLRLVEDGARAGAVANVAVSIGGGLAAAAIGLTVGSL